MDYDLIIVGSGSVGSAAGYYSAKAGSKVLMIDSSTPPHKNGSHHGATRIFRCAYGEGPKYVPLLLRAKELWRELGQLSHQEVLEECGIINMGVKDSEFMINAQTCVQEFNLNAKVLSPEEVRKRWPEVSIPNHYLALYEPESGVLKTDAAVGAYVKLSKEAGAEQVFNTTVTAVEPIENGVEVTTSAGKFTSRKTLISAGTWLKNLLPEMPIEPIRKVFMWHRTDGFKNIPGLVVGYGNSHYYGFPADNIGFKVGKHDGGQVMTSIKDYVPYGDIEEDKTEVLEFMKEITPDAGDIVHGEACTYDMTPDEAFIIDTLPNCSNVMVVTGLSGHGFKFVSALGEVASMFARDQPYPFDLSAFKLDRF